MKVLKGTPQQVEQLNGYTNGNSVLQFFPDYAGNMTIPVTVLTYPDFGPIRNELLLLEEIDYVEFPDLDEMI
jgi:hypothetical protein